MPVQLAETRRSCGIHTRRVCQPWRHRHSSVASSAGPLSFVFFWLDDIGPFSPKLAWLFCGDLCADVVETGCRFLRRFVSLCRKKHEQGGKRGWWQSNLLLVSSLSNLLFMSPPPSLMPPSSLIAHATQAPPASPSLASQPAPNSQENRKRNAGVKARERELIFTAILQASVSIKKANNQQAKQTLQSVLWQVEISRRHLATFIYPTVTHVTFSPVRRFCVVTPHGSDLCHSSLLLWRNLIEK